MQTFRQWLSKQVCKHYGHHWWVKSSVDSAVGEGESFDIFLVVEYGNCKRCGIANPDPQAGSWRTHNISVEDYDIHASREEVSVTVHHNVKTYEYGNPPSPVTTGEKEKS